MSGSVKGRHVLVGPIPVIPCYPISCRAIISASYYKTILIFYATSNTNVNNCQLNNDLKVYYMSDFLISDAKIFDIYFLPEMGSRHWVHMVYTPKKIFRPSYVL